MTADKLLAARTAIEPFARFHVSGAPDTHIITAGSRMAQRQLTMGDCRLAAMALAAFDVVEGSPA